MVQVLHLDHHALAAALRPQRPRKSGIGEACLEAEQRVHSCSLGCTGHHERHRLGHALDPRGGILLHADLRPLRVVRVLAVWHRRHGGWYLLCPLQDLPQRRQVRRPSQRRLRGHATGRGVPARDRCPEQSGRPALAAQGGPEVGGEDWQPVQGEPTTARLVEQPGAERLRAGHHDRARDVLREADGAQSRFDLRGAQAAGLHHPPRLHRARLPGQRAGVAEFPGADFTGHPPHGRYGPGVAR
mmetsp:Transcript_95866/g.275239  ORF Transcript_95866/g.275239 Transcript_95866/m.275239 type:complete len:243 (-) Transcript_95866:729-1457(-)